MKNVILISVIVLGLGLVTMLSRVIDAGRPADQTQFAEEPLYVSAPAAKRLALAFNGLAADWYWMRSLQYVGRKILAYEEQHEGRMDFGSLGSLNLVLLPQLLQVSTALDPQFMAPYEYGAMILPEVDSKEAIALLDFGIAQNPSSWRLHHHLGYIYWQRGEYIKAGDIYGVGAKLPGAPSWMAAMSARLKGEGGSRDAAREMYGHLYEVSDDPHIKRMVEKQLLRLNSLDEREKIRQLLSQYSTQTGHCPSTWNEISAKLRNVGFRVDSAGAPLDPGNVPYRLIKNGCDVDLDVKSAVPHS